MRAIASAAARSATLGWHSSCVAGPNRCADAASIWSGRHGGDDAQPALARQRVRAHQQRIEQPGRGRLGLDRDQVDRSMPGQLGSRLGKADSRAHAHASPLRARRSSRARLHRFRRSPAHWSPAHRNRLSGLNLRSPSPSPPTVRLLFRRCSIAPKWFSVNSSVPEVFSATAGDDGYRIIRCGSGVRLFRGFRSRVEQPVLDHEARRAAVAIAPPISAFDTPCSPEITVTSAAISVRLPSASPRSRPAGPPRSSRRRPQDREQAAQQHPGERDEYSDDRIIMIAQIAR